MGRAAWERASPQEGPFPPGFLGLGRGTERARRCPCWPRHCSDMRQKQEGRAGGVLEVRQRGGPQPGLKAEGEKGAGGVAQPRGHQEGEVLLVGGALRC